jgi:hypothetical protein
MKILKKIIIEKAIKKIWIIIIQFYHIN